MSGPASEEAMLRLAALAGDAHAWGQLFESAYPQVQRYLRWRCGTQQHLHDDLTQDVWHLAVRKLKSFDPHRACFASWVCGLAGYLARNAIRGQGRRLKHLAQFAQQQPQPGVVTLADGPDPDRVALALAEIAPQYEAVLRLKYLDEQPVNQIAQELKLSVKAVESLLSRARQAFREVYTDA
jgi:RNA polymerase sigma-70 factor (ECF subfamily)